MEHDTLAAAVVGVGAIGTLHAQVYAAHPLTTLAAVTDADPEQARRVGEQLGVRWFARVDEMLAAGPIDVVSIATPEQSRSKVAEQCAQAGKALLLEKPLTPTLAQTDRLIETIEATGVFAAVNYILRNDPRFVAAKQAISGGSIGDICVFSARRRGSSAAAAKFGAWTDLVISTAIHDLDAMLWLGGADVVTVHAEAFRQPARAADDAVAALLRFTNGAIGLLEASWVVPPTLPAPIDVSFHVLGTRGAVFIDGANNGFAMLDEDGYTHPDLVHWPTGRSGVMGDLRESIDHFIRAVRNGDSPAASLSDARKAEAIATRVKEALQTEEPAAVSEEIRRLV